MEVAVSIDALETQLACRPFSSQSARPQISDMSLVLLNFVQAVAEVAKELGSQYVAMVRIIWVLPSILALRDGFLGRPLVKVLPCVCCQLEAWEKLA